MRACSFANAMIEPVNVMAPMTAPSDISMRLADLSFVDATHGWASGANGIIAVTTDGGDLWNFQPAETNNELTGIVFVDTKQGWVTGEHGMLLHTVDGGVSWENLKSQTENTLWGIDFVTPSLGWAVGAKGTILRYRLKGASNE